MTSKTYAYFHHGVKNRVESETEELLRQYVSEKLRDIVSSNWSPPNLPRSHLWRIMKISSCHRHPQHISSDAVSLMKIAVQYFVGIVSKLAWVSGTKKDKRNTLMANDIVRVVRSTAKFSFLLDIVDEVVGDGTRPSEVVAGESHVYPIKLNSPTAQMAPTRCESPQPQEYLAEFDSQILLDDLFDDNLVTTWMST